MISNSASWVLDTVCGAHICNDLQVLERSRRLSKDEMILKLGDGKTVAAEAVGSLRLVVSNHIRIDLKDCYFVPRKDDQEALCWTKRDRQWYKSEAFGRFKEYRLEVENQTNRKIKALRSDRGGEYLSGEFIDYLKENGILSQWTLPGTPQLNEVAERRNRTLLDMIRSMMSFTELPPSFWGYALKTVAKLLNIASSKSVLQMPYEIWHGKPASYKYMRVWGSPAYVKRLVADKLDSRSSLCRFIEYPKETAGYYFYDLAELKIFVSTNAVFLKKDFPLDNRRDEVLIKESSEEPHHDNTHHLSLRFTLMVFQSSVGQLENLEYLRAFKARLVAKGYTQQPGVDFEETYSPVAMVKSIRIVLAVAAWYDYEIWQMDVKTAFLNDFVEEEIFMDQLEVIRGYDFVKNDYDPCIYKKISGSSVAYLVLYVDDILLIGNDVKMLGDIKAWLSTQFSMKDMGEAPTSLASKIYRDRSRRMLGLTQSSYIEKVLKRFKMEHSKRGLLPMKHGIKLSKKQSPKTNEELKRMFNIPYASAVGSIQYAVQCTRHDVAYALSRTKDIFLIYGGGELTLEGYSDASFQSDDHDAKSQSGFVFKLNGGVVAWKSTKQDTTADSTTEAEYIAASEAAKEAIWMKNYIQELGVVPSIAEPVVIFCDNNGAIAQAKEPRSHHRSKHILRRYHLFREM
ncbi:UNVERIFIED_CONTAM: Retrovirus-related Pol polyprotein from transposon TNT 1-94 [Sesamum latifolium]|uniref:Retrovirus-related Pol polyprotein from transposon TNT 1-94 n=1 Tax=Sesamum latifolium TaxID=2727402 RepID=A0AAW2X689_9LAMI